MITNRRSFLTKVGVCVLAVGGVLGSAPAKAACQRGNGAGSYELWPFDPVLGGDQPVYLIAAFGCDATIISSGASINVSKTKFSMTVDFDPSKEQAAIFGSLATFSGRLTQGNIMVVA